MDITEKDNEEKKFCMDCLMKMLRVVRPDVVSIAPETYEDGALEEVKITFNNGFSKTVNEPVMRRSRWYATLSKHYEVLRVREGARTRRGHVVHSDLGRRENASLP